MKAIMPTQTALYNFLKGNATLISKVKGVFDEVPQDQAFPYVVFGEFTSTPYKTFGRGGENVEAVIWVCSRYKGFKEAIDIGGVITELLDGDVDTKLTIAGYEHVMTKYKSAQTQRDNDGTTRYAILTFDILVQKQ
ncbi:DUF3168 domain-containing protein [Paenibacillus sp. EPM92]|uniref:DUF3168 domain-containing protein n=1 Tax=Paenibacillus sp. EPM92 TaxID=1561195 RepID=UPI001914E3B6|nr:DUF3168 domain-containing protein [Paenibacillus sp. EPM92]